MSIHCAIAGQTRLARSASPVLSERDAWVRMPAIKSPCGACTASLPCPKSRAVSLSDRHRAARALQVAPMRIRPTKHRTSARPIQGQSYALHTDQMQHQETGVHAHAVPAPDAEESIDTDMFRLGLSYEEAEAGIVINSREQHSGVGLMTPPSPQLPPA